MGFASSSSVQVGYIKEAAFGVTPTTGNYKKLRVTGESLDYAITKEASEELNSSRAVSSMIPVNAAASGGVDSEISYKEYDDLFESVLQSTYTVYGTAGVGTTFSATFTADTIEAAVAPVTTSAFTTLKKGQFFRLVAPTHANDGKICRVSLTTAPTATVITLEASTPLAVGGPIANTLLQTSRLTNGATQSSFTIERQSADIGEYWAYTGMTPSTMEVSISSGARSTLNFNFMGKKAVRGTVTNLPGVPVESAAYDIHSGSTGPVCLIWVDGQPLVGTSVQSVSLSYDNALRSQEAICELGAVGIGSGTINLTGSMEVYFANGDLFDKFASNTNIAVTISTLDNSGNGYIYTVPKANLNNVKTNAGGKDTDMMLSVEFTGLRDLANADATLRQVLFIDRVGAAVA
jgi:hypothetical protein